MNYNDHDPPCFRARYQEQEVTIEIQSGIVQGMMAKRALKLLFEWFEHYQQELADNWQRAGERRPMQRIPPLS
ncbi:MAG: DUF4160 domain-containing protein [Acidobacteriota bacterium]|nr:DUF4160 domain-containing protein [Acidobacteriota bacterium]